MGPNIKLLDIWQFIILVILSFLPIYIILLEKVLFLFFQSLVH